MDIKNGHTSPLVKFTPVSIISGLLYPTDISNSNSANNFVGIVSSESCEPGEKCLIVSFGRLTSVSGLSFGSVYISKSGILTNNIPKIGENGIVAGDYFIGVGMVAENPDNIGQKDLIIFDRNPIMKLTS